VPFYSVENLVSGNKNKYISQADHDLATAKNKPEVGDVLITRIGKIGLSKVVDWAGDFSIYVTLAVIKKSSSFNERYLHAYLQSSRYQHEIAQRSLLNAVPCKINMDELRKSVVLLPSMPEQARIAGCFSNCDTRIDAQVDWINALKAHKAGLMQQLFPSPAEAAA
jgi:type I restriction enzyme, S subunit